MTSLRLPKAALRLRVASGRWEVLAPIEWPVGNLLILTQILRIAQRLCFLGNGAPVVVELRVLGELDK
jgi:hypothetical protein